LACPGDSTRTAGLASGDTRSRTGKGIAALDCRNPQIFLLTMEMFTFKICINDIT
jgi:hypothetical protein